jgi:hypothetical protein
MYVMSLNGSNLGVYYEKYIMDYYFSCVNLVSEGTDNSRCLTEHEFCNMAYRGTFMFDTNTMTVRYMWDSQTDLLFNKDFIIGTNTICSKCIYCSYSTG